MNPFIHAAGRTRTRLLTAFGAVVVALAIGIVSFNAVQVEQLSRSIRRNLRGTLLASLALVLAGGASALFLLRRALRGLDAEDAAASARSAELEVFAARAAHELRTPLQSISLALGALERGGSAEALARSRRSVERPVSTSRCRTRARGSPRTHSLTCSSLSCAGRCAAPGTASGSPR